MCVCDNRYVASFSFFFTCIIRIPYPVVSDLAFPLARFLSLFSFLLDSSPFAFALNPNSTGLRFLFWMRFCTHVLLFLQVQEFAFFLSLFLSLSLVCSFSIYISNPKIHRSSASALGTLFYPCLIPYI